VKSILVTGGAGFVGAHLALGFKAADDAPRVVAFDNLHRRGSELNLPRLRAGGVDFVHGDIRVPADLEAVGPVDLILECSAEPSVLAGYGESPEYAIQTNLLGTVNALEHARRHGAGMIFLSTSRVYPLAAIRTLNYAVEATRFTLAPEQTLPGVSGAGISEAFPLEGTRSLYGATKLCSELLLLEYLEMYGLRGVINRCGVLTGPGQMGKQDQGVVVLWLARHLWGGPLQYIGYGGTGKQVRDLLHVEDLLRLVRHQARHLEALSGETFNVGGGPSVSASLQELTALCQEITGRHVEIGAVPQEREADIPLYLSDNAKLTQHTGWRPEHGVQETLLDIYRWMETHQEALQPILGPPGAV